MGVIDSTLKMSCGAGIANQIKFGIIIKKKSANPQISKPNLYFFKIYLPPQTGILCCLQLDFLQNIAYIH